MVLGPFGKVTLKLHRDDMIRRGRSQEVMAAVKRPGDKGVGGLGFTV